MSGAELSAPEIVLGGTVLESHGHWYWVLSTCFGVLGGDQRGASGTWVPKARWGQLRRRRFLDLAAQNPDSAERNARPEFWVSYPGDGHMFWGDLGPDGS